MEFSSFFLIICPYPLKLASHTLSVKRKSSCYSNFLIPPPPSIATMSKPGTPLQKILEQTEPTDMVTPRPVSKTPEPSSTRERQTTTTLLDIMTKVSQSFHRGAFIQQL